jgi:TP901 family phage tail tape measure protein
LEDFASLGIEVDGKDLRHTSRDFDKFVAAGSKAEQAAKRVGSSTQAMGAKTAAASAALTSATRGLIGLTAGIASFAGAAQAVSKSRDFQAAMAETSTLIEGTRAEMQKLERESQRFAATFGGDAAQQVRAYYQAISAGADGVIGATEVLEQANKLATGGVTDITTAVDGLTTAVNAYGADVLSSAEASDAMFVGMKAGKTTISELAAQLGQIVPIAASAGVAFDEVVAGMAALTTQGQSTAQASTGLRQVIASVIKPTSQAAEMASKLGLAFNAQALESKGLAVFLEEVVEKTGGNTEAMAQLFGSVEALNAALAFAGGAGDKFSVIMDQMGAKAGATDAAFEKMSSNMDQRLNSVLAELGNLILNAGNALLRALVPAMEAFVRTINSISSGLATFSQWMSGTITQAEAHELAMDNVTIAMGDQIRATARLTDALRQGGPVTLAAIEAKIQEAEALREVTAELVRQRQEKELEALGYYGVLESMAQYRQQLDALRTPGDDLEQMPATLRDAYEEAEAGLANVLRQQQELLESVRSQNHLTAEEQANLDQIEANLAELQRRWNVLNGITEENVSLTDRASGAAIGLANSLGAATGQASALSGFLSTLPGALAGAEAKIAGLQAGIANLASGGNDLSANVARYRAELEASLPPMESLQDGQRAYVRENIDAKVKLYEQEQRLSQTYRDQLSSLNKIESVGGSAGKKISESMTEAERAAEALRERIDGDLTTGVNRLTDVITDGMFNGFDGTLRSIGDLFKRWLSQMISTAIANPILIGMGVGGTLGGTAAASVLGGAGGGGGSSVLSGLVGSQAGNLFGGLGGGSGLLGGLGQGVAGVFSGGGLGSSFANLGGLVSGSVGGLGAIGAALPAIGIIAGAAVALKKAFSREYQFSGIRGNFDAQGFTGQGFDFHKGGAFRSDKTDYYPLDPELETLLDTQARALNDSIHQMADSLLLDKAVLDGFVSDFVQVNTNQDQEKILADLTAELEKSGEKMADLVLGTADFSREGENALDTLTRLSTGLIAVNDVMDLLGHTAFDVGLIGADAASQLAEAFGGVEAMSSAANTYWAAFYTVAERQETTLRRLTAQFSELEITMPRSREQFRDLVESIDLTTERGRELYASLLSLSGAMDEVLPSVAQFTLEMTGMLNNIGGEVGSMLDAARQNARITETAAALWYRTATTLRDFLSDLVNSDLSALSESQGLALNRSQFQAAFELARGGDVDAARSIPDLTKALLKSELANATSAAEYRRISGQIQGQVNFLAGISELEGANDDVLTTLYQQQIDVLTSLGNFLQLEGLTNEQIEALDGTIQDLARDFDGTLEEFDAALGNLESAIREAENFSYDYLKERLKVTVDLLPTASIPVYLRELIAQSAEGITSHIDFIVRTDLSAPDKWLAVNGASEHIKTIEFLVNDAQFSDEMQDLAFGAAGVFRQTVQFIAQNGLGNLTELALGEVGTFVQRIKFTAGAIPQPARDIVLNELDEVTRHINFLQGDTIPDEMQRLALDQADRFRRVINIVAGALPLEDVQKLALSDPARFQRALNFFVGKIPNARIQSLALDAADDFTRVVNVQAGSLPNNEVIRLALSAGSELRRNISLILRKDIDAETRRIVLAGNSELSRVVNVALNRSGSDREALILALGNIRDYGLTVEASLSPNISAEVRKLVFEGAGTYAALVEASFQLDGAERRILLRQQGNYVTNITASLSRAIDPRVRRLLLEANTTAIRGITIASVFADAIPAAQRALLLQESTTALRTITARVNSNGISSFEALFLRQLQDTGSVTRTLRGRVYPQNVGNLGQAILRELGRTSGGYVDRNIRARLLALGISELDRDMLDQLQRNNGNVDRNIRSRITAIVTGKDNTAIFRQLGFGSGTIARNISSAINAKITNPTDRAVLNILANYGGWTNRAIRSWIHSTVSGDQNADFLELLIDRNGWTDRGIRSWLHSQAISGKRNSQFWDLLNNRGYWSNRMIRSGIETQAVQGQRNSDFFHLLTERGYWTTRAIRSRIESDAPSGDRNSKFYHLLTNSAERARRVRGYMHSSAPSGQQNANFYNLLTNSAVRHRQVHGFMHSSVNGTQNQRIFDQLVAGNGTTDREIFSNFASNVDPQDARLLRQLEFGKGTIDRSIWSNFGSNVDNMDARLLTQLEAGKGTIERIIRGRIDLANLNAQQRALLNSIDGSSTGTITLAGTYKFAPEAAFKSWYASTSQSYIQNPMNSLRGAIMALRDEIAGQRLRDEQKQSLIDSITGTAGAYVNQLSSNQNWAASLVNQVKELQKQTGTQILDAAGNAAHLFIGPDGSIQFNGASIAGGNTQLFASKFYGTGKLNDYMSRANSNIAFIEGKLDAARRQIVSLGGIPGFAAGGAHSGGWRIVGEKGPELEYTGPSRVISNSQSRDMLDNREVVAELKMMRRLLKEYADENNRLMARIDNSTDAHNRRNRKWDVDGQPAERT